MEELSIVSIIVGFFSPFLIEGIKWLGKKITNELIRDRLAFLLTIATSLIISVISLVLEGKVSISLESIIANWGLIFMTGQIAFKALNGTKLLPRAN